MSSFEWFLLIVVVVVVPLIIAVVVTLWTIEQANKRKRANRKDAQIGVKRQAALNPEEAAARKAARADRDAAAAMDAAADKDLEASAVTINNLGAAEASTATVTSASGKTITINNVADEITIDIEETADSDTAVDNRPTA